MTKSRTTPDKGRDSAAQVTRFRGAVRCGKTLVAERQTFGLFPDFQGADIFDSFKRRAEAAVDNLIGVTPAQTATARR